MSCLLFYSSVLCCSLKLGPYTFAIKLSLERTVGKIYRDVPAPTPLSHRRRKGAPLAQIRAADITIGRSLLPWPGATKFKNSNKQTKSAWLASPRCEKAE